MLRSKFNLRSLKTKIMFMMALLVSIPLLTLGIVSSTNSHNAMEDSVHQQLESLSQSTAENIEAQINSLDLIISAITQDPLVKEVVAGNESAKVHTQSLLSNNIAKTGDLIETLLITNTTSSIMTDSNTNEIIDLTDREYFLDTLKGNTSTSSVIISKKTGNPVIAVSHPIIQDGEVIGTVIAAANFNVLTKKIAEIKVFEGGYGYIFNADGLALYHPTEANRMTLNLKSLNIPEVDAMLSDVAAGKAGERYYTYNDEYKYVRYVIVNGWGVAITANYSDYMAAAIQIRNVTAIITLLAIVISLTLIFLFINKSVVRPIQALNTHMNAAGEGDLTVRSQIASGDELQELSDQFNTMINSQENIVEHVRQESTQLSKTSDSVSRSSMEVSSATEEIAASITEVAHHTDQQNNDVVEASQIMLQFSTLIELAKITAIEAQVSMSKSLDAAETGRSTIDDNKKAILNIQETSEETSSVLGELSNLSKQVGGIVESINAISSQTNMLALNAAIESARAGIHGQGFAVVADQVRHLAEQTSLEAEKINQVIEHMVSMIDNAANSMKQGKVAVDKGVEISSQTDEAFVAILSEVKMTMEKILHIVDVTDEEVASSERIIQVIDKVACLTEQTALNAQSVAAGAQEQASVVTEVAENTINLKQMATTLEELVNKFRTRGEINV